MSDAVSTGYKRHDDGIEQRASERNAQTNHRLSTVCPRRLRFISVPLLHTSRSA